MHATILLQMPTSKTHLRGVRAAAAAGRLGAGQVGVVHRGHADDGTQQGTWHWSCSGKTTKHEGMILTIFQYAGSSIHNRMHGTHTTQIVSLPEIL